jgi:hypothetical protein
VINTGGIQVRYPALGSISVVTAHGPISAYASLWPRTHGVFLADSKMPKGFRWMVNWHLTSISNNATLRIQFSFVMSDLERLNGEREANSKYKRSRSFSLPFLACFSLSQLRRSMETRRLNPLHALASHLPAMHRLGACISVAAHCLHAAYSQSVRMEVNVSGQLVLLYTIKLNKVFESSKRCQYNLQHDSSRLMKSCAYSQGEVPKIVPPVTFYSIASSHHALRLRTSSIVHSNP